MQIDGGARGILSHPVAVVQVVADLLEHALIQQVGKRIVSLNTSCQQSMHEHIGVSTDERRDECQGSDRVCTVEWAR